MKVKIFPRSVIRGSATAIKRKAINARVATPSNASNGKIKMNRTNEKGENINIMQKNYLQIQPKVRMCFVNIKRDSSLLFNSSSVVNVKGGNCNKQLTTTLQDQCTDGMDRKGHSQITVGKASKAKNPSMAAEANVPHASTQDKPMNGHNTATISQLPCTVDQCTTLKDTDGNNIDHILKMQAKANSAVAMRKCVVKLKRIPKSSRTQEIYARNAAKDALLASQIISPTLDHEKRSAFRKLSLSMHYNSKDNDENTVRQASVVAKASGNAMVASNSKNPQKQKLAINSANKSTGATKKCHPQRNLRSSKQSTTSTKMEQQNERRITNRNNSQFPSSCEANPIEDISDKYIKQGSSKENLIENQYINTSSSCDKENKTTRYEFRKHAQLSNALKTNQNILASDRCTNNRLRGVSLSNKDDNFSLSKNVELHRSTSPLNSNTENITNSILLTTTKNREAQKESETEDRLKNKFKNNSPNTCREKEIDKVLDNCISEKLVEKEAINNSLRAGSENTEKIVTSKAVKTDKKCLVSEKSGLNSNNVQVIEVLTSLSKNLQPSSTSKDGSSHSTGIEKDAPKKKCIKLPGNSSARQNNCSSSIKTGPKLTVVNGNEYNIQNTSEIIHFLPHSNSTMSPNCLKKNNLKQKVNDDNIKIVVRPKPTIPSKEGKSACKQRPSAATETNERLLSLRTANKIVNTPTILNFQPQRNSTMHFGHLGHLTVMETNMEDDENEAGAQDNRILEVSDNISHSHSPTENHTKSSNKTNKFFHRYETQNSQRTEMAHTKHMFIMNTKNSRLLPKRSSQIRREKVYDFLSQSQTSDSDGMGGGTINHKPTDPAADIIKKLIAEGKVVVATRRKGTGKPVLKRNRKNYPKKAMAKKKVVKKKNVKAVDNTSPSKNFAEKLKSPVVVENEAEYFVDDHFMDNDDDVRIIVGKSYNFPKPLTVEPAKTGLLRNPNADQEGTFSNLARSVLINQAGRNEPQRLKAQRLLSMAKNLISTPKNNNIPSIRTTINADFSPIPSMIQPRTATKPSPWRVDEDAHLPTVFNFSRSSGNLPSFSSDFIPPTPRKEKPNSTNKSKLADFEVQPVQFDSSPLPIIEGIAAIPSQFPTPSAISGVTSTTPSYSSNDSNAENKTPPGQSEPNNDENANIFNLKQFANPRRALNYRSPLKAINITEVVHLPPLQMSKITNYKENPKVATICNNKDLSKVERLKSVDIQNEDLFGFEDFLSQTEHSSHEDGLQAAFDVPTSKEPTNIINEKRYGLRKLKPDTTVLQICLQRTAAGNTEKTSEKNKHLFIDAQFVSKPQKTVKEMLCSTMCHKNPTTSRNALEEHRDQANYHIEEESNFSGMLFRDIEPETTFNEEDPHRTYIRPHKRKRRLKEDRLIFALESEESDNEGNDSAGKKKSANNHSRETDTSSEKQPPNKKKKRQRKEKPELIHFVKDFNEMCKEVEKYKLIVEKSV